ncbi:MAG: hypothetical protein V1660_00055 [archaeon]
MDVNLLGFLKDGTYRIKTLEILNKKHMLSSELAIELDVNRASMSRILKVLKEKNLHIQIKNEITPERKIIMFQKRIIIL